MSSPRAVVGSAGPRLALVCSNGGHFLQLYLLRGFWGDAERFWVTFQGPDTEALLSGERVFWAHHPTNRHLGNLVRNLGLALSLLRHERPTLIVSTGAGVGVPFVWIGRMLGIPTVYIEELTRTRTLSLSGKLVRPITDHFLVQWPELAGRYSRARFEGRVL
jgi:beta-1,4-N-acetylglucosaminyltransferase